MQKTGIEYLTHTCNPIAMRCTKCSPGCERCWHLTTADRLCNNMALPEDERKALAGTGPFILRQRELSAFNTKKQSVIGIQFMGDLFHEGVTDSFQYEVYKAMILNKQNTYLILTKRPAIMAKFLSPETCFQNPAHPHIWHGLTICNQQEADEKIPIFLQVPGKKFLSIEPMLGPIQFPAKWAIIECPKCNDGERWTNSAQNRECHFCGSMQVIKSKINAVILGGETGHGARPLHPDWVRMVRNLCSNARVPFFFKQWGEYRTSTPDDMESAKHHRFEYGESFYRVGRKKAGRELDGRTHDDLPWVK